MKGKPMTYIGWFVGAFFGARAVMFMRLAQGADDGAANTAFVVSFIVLAAIVGVVIHLKETRR